MYVAHESILDPSRLVHTPAWTRTNSTTNKGCESGHQLGQQEAVLSKKVVGAIPTQEASLSVRVQACTVGITRTLLGRTAPRAERTSRLREGGTDW